MATFLSLSSLGTAAVLAFGAIRGRHTGDRVVYGIAAAGFAVAAGLMAAGGVR